MNSWTVCSKIPCSVDTAKDMQKTTGSEKEMLHYNTNKCPLQ